MMRNDDTFDHGYAEYLGTRTLVQCPVCRSADLDSLKLDNVPFGEMASTALAARRTGHPARAIGLVIGWAGIETINHLPPHWKCQNCDEVF